MTTVAWMAALNRLMWCTCGYNEGHGQGWCANCSGDLYVVLAERNDARELLEDASLALHNCVETIVGLGGGFAWGDVLTRIDKHVGSDIAPTNEGEKSEPATCGDCGCGESVENPVSIERVADQP